MTQSHFIVQQPSTEDTIFHVRTEGQSSALDWVFNNLLDDILATKFGPAVPFWENPLGQAISEYGTSRPYYIAPML